MSEKDMIIKGLREQIKSLNKSNDELNRQLELAVEKAIELSDELYKLKKGRDCILSKSFEEGLSLVTHNVMFKGKPYTLKEFVDGNGECVHYKLYESEEKEIYDQGLVYNIREFLDQNYMGLN